MKVKDLLNLIDINKTDWINVGYLENGEFVAVMGIADIFFSVLSKFSANGITDEMVINSEIIKIWCEDMDDDENIDNFAEMFIVIDKIELKENK